MYICPNCNGVDGLHSGMDICPPDPIEIYKPPLKFKAHYEGECGESYEVYGIAVPILSLPCEECDESHIFELKYVEHIW